MIVTKNGFIEEITDRTPVIRAYLQSGWVEVKEEDKPSSTTKAPAKRAAAKAKE